MSKFNDEEFKLCKACEESYRKSIFWNPLTFFIVVKVETDECEMCECHKSFGK
jgi:hypothetical protein